MYDKYNNVYRWVPTNGDVAGVMAKSIKDSYAWYSPAGPQRGIFKNVTRLRYSPSQDQRDDLYSARINPIITTPGTGTYLFGDKTALSYPSAFDRINVRRLFLLVEDRIERFSQAQLFEFNDEVTRANFRNQVEPYLRDIQAKRGIKDFVVICDDSNNTPDVIDANEFKADIFIQPARSINYIGLQFIATRTGVSFAEVVGTV
jgi:phage tail sheath protein FI